MTSAFGDQSRWRNVANQTAGRINILICKRTMTDEDHGCHTFKIFQSDTKNSKCRNQVGRGQEAHAGLRLSINNFEHVFKREIGPGRP